MSDFCGPEGFGPFAPKDVRVDFTPCFEEIMFFLLAKVAMIVFGLWRLYDIWNKPAPPQATWSIPFVGKMISSVALFGIYVAQLVLVLIDRDEVYGYQILGPATAIVAVLIAGILHAREQHRVRRTSPILALFWFVTAIGCAFKLATFIRSNEDDGTLFILFCVEMGLIYTLFILSCLRLGKSLYVAIGEDEKQSPEATANIFSVLSFWWFNPLMVLGYQKPLTMEDMWALNRNDRAEFVSSKFEEAWAAELKTKKPSLVWALTKSLGGMFFAAAIFKLAQDVLSFVQPVLLEQLMFFIESYCDGCETEEPMYRGYLIAFGMFATAVVQTILLHQYFHRCFVVGMRVRAAIVTAVYKKAFRLSNDSRQKSTVGEIVNHMAIDAQRLMDLCGYLHIVWSGPVQIVLALYLLYQTLGPAVFAGLLVMISLIPFNAWLANKMKTLQQAQMKNKDTRIKLMDEILGGIKVIKLYAWEIPFIGKVHDVRGREMATLKRIAYMASIQTFTWTCAPFLVSIASFIFFIIIEKEPLTSEKAFVSLTLFNMLQFPLTMLPSVITSLVEASVAVNRLFNFLTSDELDMGGVIRRDRQGNEPASVKVSNASFGWSKTSGKATLENINLDIKSGALVAVVGSVGSGKSSLISALLGNMEKMSGTVSMTGSVAYVAQQAWILNATLKENIYFGRPGTKENYQSTIDACALRPDIEILPAGDLTEIGEKGINLSGGQKQRVSIARAVFGQSDIYLFDDPLSAVDAHVGAHIFDKVIGPKGSLKNKIRILVTHGMQYLPKADLIVVLKNGTISEMGSYNELVSAEGEFSRLVTEFATKEHEEALHQESVASREPSKDAAITKTGRTPSQDIQPALAPSGKSINAEEGDLKPQPKPKSNIISMETSEVGEVKMSVYKLYFGSMGLAPVLGLLALYVLGQGAQIGMNMWLEYWSSQNSNDQIGLYIGVYGVFGVVLSGFVVLQSIVTYVVCGIRAATTLHEGLLQNVMRAPMSFFDTTPLGRILNRFSKDQNTIDEVLPRTFQSFFRTMFNVIGILFIISYSTFYFLVAIIPLGALYFFIQRYYLATSRELKRLDSVTRSPIYSHFSETLSGVTSIRAYQQVDKFTKENETRLNSNQLTYYPSIVSNRWLATRLEWVGALVVLLAALLAVIAFGQIDASTVGLSVSYALTITQTLNWMVRMSCDLEANIVSVERAKEYSQIKTEAPAIISDHRPHESWPQRGTIEFKGYSTRYREGLDLVLKEINCSISSGEKIGVVGRTGAGKSSLTLALFRIIESAAGAIIVDGTNINTIGLQDLRSNLTIIPQDPVLFSGTIRDNLDPFVQYTDDQVWRALECAHLKGYVSSLEKKLDHPVAQGGENLSVGQRQLICLARALLRKTKILVLDEATAAIDVETDDIIQKTIRKEFQACTIITIAHRINTIMDSNRILVLDQGAVAEFESPEVLLTNPTSIFFSLARQAGLV